MRPPIHINTLDPRDLQIRRARKVLAAYLFNCFVDDLHVLQTRRQRNVAQLACEGIPDLFLYLWFVFVLIVHFALFVLGMGGGCFVVCV